MEAGFQGAARPKQLGPLGVAEPERRGETSHGGRSWPGDAVGLDVADGTDADPGSFGQLGLGQSDSLAQPANPLPKIHRVRVPQIITRH